MKKFRVMTLVVASLLFCGAAFADDCATEIEGNDLRVFNKESIAVPAACKEFTVTLKHVGKMSKADMGHNWVLTKAADMKAVLREGQAAGLARDYLNAADAKIIAHTRLIGGGESDAVTWAVSKLTAGESYVYFCSYPGHGVIMSGTLTVR
jgi:azurin